MPCCVNNLYQLSEVEDKKNHYVIGIVNWREKTFTTWRMSNGMYENSKAEYDKVLGFTLDGTRNKVRNPNGPIRYPNNCFSSETTYA